MCAFDECAKNLPLQVNTEFRDEINKFRDYTRALSSYKRQLQKIQQDQRRAEWEARKKEAEGPIDADLPSDDPLVGHPWADEILQCKDLEKVLASFLPKEAKAEAAKEEEKEKTWLKGAAGKMVGKDEADLAVSKKSKGEVGAGGGRPHRALHGHDFEPERDRRLDPDDGGRRAGLHRQGACARLCAHTRFLCARACAWASVHSRICGCRVCALVLPCVRLYTELEFTVHRSVYRFSDSQALQFT
jgi:hypothetical protein